MRFAMFWWHLMCVFWVRQAGVCRGRQTDRWMIAVISEHTGCFILSLSFSAVAHDFLPSSCKSVSVLCSSSTGPARGTFWGYFKSQTVALQSRIIGKSRKDATPMQNINFSLSPHARDWKGIKEVTHRSSLEKKKINIFPLISSQGSGVYCSWSRRTQRAIWRNCTETERTVPAGVCSWPRWVTNAHHRTVSPCIHLRPRSLCPSCLSVVTYSSGWYRLFVLKPTNPVWENDFAL